MVRGTDFGKRRVCTVRIWAKISEREQAMRDMNKMSDDSNRAK